MVTYLFRRLVLLELELEMRIKPQRLKKRHNLKGRIQHHESKPVNDQAAAHIHVDPKIFGSSGYATSAADSSNQLILPSVKSSVKRKFPVPVAEKRLSKRQRKALEKVVAQKKKKEQRSSVLEDLDKYRLDVNQLDKLVTVVSLTRGALPKKSRYETDGSDRHAAKDVRIRPLTGSRKKGGALFNEGVPVEKMNLAESSEEDEDGEVEIVAESKNEEQEDKEHEPAHLEVVEEVKNEPIDVEPEVSLKLSANDVSSSPKTDSLISDKTPVPTMPSQTPVVVESSEELVEQVVVQRKLKYKPVCRDEKMQESRLKLPILSEEHAIMEAISDNSVVIICGETGSGKTTQVPQFLYEAGYSEYGIIGVTEPRRVAAVAMSRRVAEEMSMVDSGQVSFVIRYEGTASSDTKIKFMTDGVLLKEVENDFLLSAYSVIVIDEAHERSVFTDILIGLLSRIVRLRAKRGNPLKLVIMSATLRVDDFTANKHLFSEVPPVIKIESRQFPVTVHFSRETPSDYLAETYRKVCQIHREQPAGGILVFVTGQDEVRLLLSKLRAKFGLMSSNGADQGDEEPQKKKYLINRHYASKKTRDKVANEDGGKSLFDSLHVNLDEYSLKSEVDGEIDHEEESGEIRPKLDDNDGADLEGDDKVEEAPMWVLPLYALLPTEKQQLVFQPPPNPSARLCVISTNVGETSLTIPNIRYVIDTGKVKTKLYDKVTGVSTFVITWASKASAVQRAGRAGRVGPGHCYRLYSTAMFTDEMAQFAEPEIARRPVDDLVLQMKAIGIDRVMNFPFPTPPPNEAIAAAENLLVKLGALIIDEAKSDNNKIGTPVARITDLGRLMARLPVSPRFSRVLCSAPDRKSLTYLIAMLSGLSVQELLLNECEDRNDSENDNKQSNSIAKIRRIRSAWSPPGEGRLLGDAGLFLRAIGAAEYSNATLQFCRACGIRLKALLEARKVRRQLTSIVNSLHPSIGVVIDPQMAPPSDADCLLLRKLLLSGFGDRVAKRIEDIIGEVTTDESGKQRRKGSKPGGSYAANALDGVLTIHPSSVLYREPPTFIMFQEVSETSTDDGSRTTYLKLVTEIEPKWLHTVCPGYCSFGDIAEDDQVAGESVGPRWSEISGTVRCHRKASFGTHNWNLGLVEVDYPTGIDRIRWFARLFLEGKVISALEQYVPVLLGAPVSVVKSWGRLQPRTEMLVRTLYAKNVDSLASLIEIWQDDSKFMLSSYLEWLPSSLHAQVSAAWPPIVVLPRKK